jgi:hypothetical protein
MELVLRRKADWIEKAKRSTCGLEETKGSTERTLVQTIGTEMTRLTIRGVAKERERSGEDEIRGFWRL